MKQVAPQLQRSISQLPPRALCNYVYAAGHLGTAMPRRVSHATVRAIARQLPYMGAKQVANMSVGLARLPILSNARERAELARLLRQRAIALIASGEMRLTEVRSPRPSAPRFRRALARQVGSASSAARTPGPTLTALCASPGAASSRVSVSPSAAVAPLSGVAAAAQVLHVTDSLNRIHGLVPSFAFIAFERMLQLMLTGEGNAIDVAHAAHVIGKHRGGPARRGVHHPSVRALVAELEARALAFLRARAFAPREAAHMMWMFGRLRTQPQLPDFRHEIAAFVIRRVRRSAGRDSLGVGAAGQCTRWCRA